jgi:hypothetical protein
VDKKAKMRLFCSKKSYAALLAIGSLLLFIAIHAAVPVTSYSAEIKSSELVKLETRPGVKQKFILIKPENPIASVILLEGGDGSIQLGGSSRRPTIGRKQEGFIVRTRKEFAKHGLIVALVDVPSDRRSQSVQKYTVFRMSAEHAKDIQAVASYLKNEADIPVWVVGMSLGTFSTTNTAIRYGQSIDGLVLASSTTRTNPKWPSYKTHPQGILSMSISEIVVPTLIVSHKNDKCRGSPSSDIPLIEQGLANSSKVEVSYFTGGKRPISKPCHPKSAHGFYGLDDEVVQAIADFIKANSK